MSNPSGPHTGQVWKGVNTGCAVRGVLIGQGADPVAVVAPDTAGKVLTSNGSNTDPTWQAGSSVSMVSVALTSQQILNLAASPVTIVAAPGEGRALVPIAWLITLTDSDYTNNGTTDFYFGSNRGDTGLSAGGQTPGDVFAAGTGGGMQFAPAHLYTTTDIENEPIVLATVGADLTDGAGTGMATIIYATVDL